MMDVLKKNAVVLITIAVVTAAAVVWYFVFFNPESAKLNTLRSQQDTLTATRQSLTSRLEALKKAQVKQPERLATLNRYVAEIPPTPDMATFIDQMNSLAGQSGVKILTFAPSPPTGGSGGVSPITISCSVSGTYRNTITFIHGLYALPRLVVIDTLNVAATISSAGGGSANAAQPTVDQINTSMTMRVFTTSAPPSGSSTSR